MQRNNEGQALVLVLLSIGVVLAVALSVVSRSIVDVSTTASDEQSLRAFSAAEAGVEQVLRNQIASLPTSTTQPAAALTPQSSYVTKLDAYPLNPREFIYPTELSSGDTATVWLATHATDNSLTCAGSVPCFVGQSMNVCWGKTGNGIVQPALVVSILYEQAGALRYAYATFDPDSSRRSRNQFGSSVTSSATGACNIGGTSFANSATVTFTSVGVPASVVSGRGLRALSGMLVYNTAPTTFGVSVSSDLPVQGRRIESTGVSGDSTRKVQVYSLYPEIPSMFQAAIFSPPGVVK